MMILRWVVLVLVISFSFSCRNIEVGSTATQQNYLYGVSQIISFDGCEYFMQPQYAGGAVYTHKGNCKNPIHNQNIEGQKQLDIVKAQLIEKDKQIDLLKKLIKTNANTGN